MPDTQDTTQQQTTDTTQAATQPAAQTGATQTATDPAKELETARNDAAKWRRLAEKHEKAIQERERAEKARADAELPELERLKKLADEATADANKAKADTLRLQVVVETGLDAGAVEFLTGTDEETLRAQAGKLKGMMGSTGTRAGTLTNPGGNQQPSIDEQIAAAQKAGNTAEAIRLKREKAGLGRQPG
jgi:uncharacterized protein YdcH (DUF465 family)